MYQSARRFVLVLALSFFAINAFAADDPAPSDMTPRKVKKAYQHLLVIGDDFHVSKGNNMQSPIFAYYWFGENFANPDLYTQFTLTTTRIYFIAAYKTERVFVGVKPLVEHSTYAGYRLYKKGYIDRGRSIKGNNAGAGIFIEYNWLRILSTKITFHPSYHFYRFPLISPNEHKTINLPHDHWQVKPGIELSLSDVKVTDLNRVKHGYLFRVEYQYARRIGYGTWYDYDRLVYRERYEGTWIPTMPSGVTEGIWYKSRVNSTHRLYFNAGGYYNFAGGYNLQFDVNGGYFKGVDRNNAEQIGYFLADNAVMPGYALSEFLHTFYLISRLQIGIPIPFWETRIQPGFNVLYMPTGNGVIGVGRGAITNQWLVRGYPRRIYTSVSVGLSTKLGNFVPIFIDYAYGIDALRTKSATSLYLGRIERGNHEFRIMLVMAFVKNDV